MFGKYQAIFRSRWRALIWAGGVLLTAYCTVPSADEGAADPDQAVFAALMAANGQGSQKEHKHVNPWALPPEQQHH